MFISYVHTLYANIESTVLNGGHSTGYFPVNRGVRQGDPLSPYLFILALEPLLITIRQSTEINGILVNGETQKINAFADDITALLVIDNLLIHS